VRKDPDFYGALFPEPTPSCPTSGRASPP